MAFRTSGLNFTIAVAAMLSLGPSTFARASEEDDQVARHSTALLFGSENEMHVAIAALDERGKPDVAAALILALKYRRREKVALSAALRNLTGSEAEGWFDAMLWQEAHPEVRPHASFLDLKLTVFERLDPEFLRFVNRERVLTQPMKIRLEEITWGGVRVDEIPALDRPLLIAAGEADYLQDNDLVFGVEINGDARAYPLRIMGWHEMFNEVIGGVPVSLAYCTLCGSGILFEGQVAGRAEPFTFGSSGFLYRSNKLMYDRQTDSLWNQFTGRPVVGPLSDSGIELKIRPVAITSWQKWRQAHPASRVLSLATGYYRDYGSGVVYNDYFASPDLMFPAVVANEDQLKRKDYVFGIRDVAAAKAWPVDAFLTKTVINDAVGLRDVVLIGDAFTRTVRAYDRQGRRFAPANKENELLDTAGGTWRITEEALTGPGGTRLGRVPGHIAYWFAWDGYLGVKSELYQAAGE